MSTLPRRLILSVAALAAVPFAAHAHHGWGGYDSSRVTTLVGTIEQAAYTNPHGMVTLRTPDKLWRVVLAPPMRMENRGLAAAALAVGATATVEGYVNKTEADELRAERITIEGRTTELR